MSDFGDSRAVNEVGEGQEVDDNVVDAQREAILASALAVAEETQEVALCSFSPSPSRGAKCSSEPPWGPQGAHAAHKADTMMPFFGIPSCFVFIFGCLAVPKHPKSHS